MLICKEHIGLCVFLSMAPSVPGVDAAMADNTMVDFVIHTDKADLEAIGARLTSSLSVRFACRLGQDILGDALTSACMWRLPKSQGTTTLSADSF
ncbi:hypothetical protein HJFPF1_08731 [Paramyrothecium foliicola]|nr:hypothetical protein HJFPF1_08731 [Paramyrothecium foliicola]